MLDASEQLKLADEWQHYLCITEDFIHSRDSKVTVINVDPHGSSEAQSCEGFAIVAAPPDSLPDGKL